MNLTTTPTAATLLVLLSVCLIAEHGAVALKTQGVHSIKNPTSKLQQAPARPPKPRKLCRSCQLQPGNAVLLQAASSRQCLAAAKSRSAQTSCTPEELTLQVKSLLGRGAVAEVYEVTVQHHALPAPAPAGAESHSTPPTTSPTTDSSAPVTDAGAHAAAAASNASAAGAVAASGATEAGQAAADTARAGPLQGLRLALKVCQRWQVLSASVQARLYADDPSTYEVIVTSNMQASHWAMSSPVLGAGNGILRSHVFGKVSRLPGAEQSAGAKAQAGTAANRYPDVVPSPALLMDLAAGGSLQLQMAELQKAQGNDAMLSKQQAHVVVAGVLRTLERLHGAGWVYLDLKADNLVSLKEQDLGQAAESWHSSSGTEVPAGSRTQQDGQAEGFLESPYLLIDFSSATFLGGADQRKHFTAMSTFISPELASDSLATRAADIWALGMLLLELRVGVPPEALDMRDDNDQPAGLLSQETHASTLQALRQEPKYAALTDREWAFIERCLVYDWQQRLSAQELVKDAYIMHGA